MENAGGELEGKSYLDDAIYVRTTAHNFLMVAQREIRCKHNILMLEVIFIMIIGGEVGHQMATL